MSKMLVLDQDGVVIFQEKYFSKKYSEASGIPWEVILEFFNNEFKLTLVGKVSIKKVLPKYLKKWGWKGSLKSFLKYWFESERTLDTRLLNYVTRLRKTGKRVCLSSVNEKERESYIWNTLKLKNYFDKAYLSYELGCTKSDPKFFQKIIQDFKIKPQDIDYWDDDPKNVEVAKSVGINAKVYTSFEDFKKSV